MRRIQWPLAACCLLIAAYAPAEGLVPARTCAANPRSQLVLTGQAPVVVAFASDASSVVYQRWDGSYPYILADLVTGRRTETFDWFITYSADERGAIFWNPGNVGPPGLLEITAATGATSVIFEGEVATIRPIAERRAVLLLNDSSPSWVYFTDTRQLLQLSPTPLSLFDFKLSSDETLAVFRSGTELWFADVPSRSTGTLSSAVSSYQLVSGMRSVLFSDTSGGLWHWTPESGAVQLDSNARGVSTSAAGEVLWIDAEDQVRLWRPASGTTVTVASGAEWAALSPSGNRIAFVRRAGSQPRALVMRDLASGEEQVVLETPRPVGGKFSNDGRFLAFSEEFADELGEHEYYSARLWDFSKASEVPLSGPLPDTHFGVTFRFHQGGAILEVVVWDRETLLFDTASGAIIYRTSRSVVSDEGVFSYWSPDDSLFFTPVGGYGDRPFDLYVFQPATGRESFVGRKVWLGCFVGQRPVFFHDATEGYPVNVGKLATWDPGTEQRRQLSPHGGDLRCLSPQNAVLFRENLQSRPGPLPQETGTLVYASLSKQRRTVLGRDVNAYVAHENELMYSDSNSICRVRF